MPTVLVAAMQRSIGEHRTPKPLFLLLTAVRIGVVAIERKTISCVVIKENLLSEEELENVFRKKVFLASKWKVKRLNHSAFM